MTRRTTILASLLVAAIFMGVACSDNPDELASTALQEGLDAQVAGRLDEASERFEVVLEHDPDNQFALYNLGLIAQTNGNLFEAEERYRAALAVDPGFTSALFNLAIVRTSLGAADEAVALYRQLIAVSPDDANAHLNLGFLLKDIGQRKEGNAEIARAIELNPELIGSVPTTPEPTSEASPEDAATPTPTP